MEIHRQHSGTRKKPPVLNPHPTGHVTLTGPLLRGKNAGWETMTHPVQATSLQFFFLCYSHLSNFHRPTKDRQGTTEGQPVHYKETFQGPPSSSA